MVFDKRTVGILVTYKGQTVKYRTEDQITIVSVVVYIGPLIESNTDLEPTRFNLLITQVIMHVTEYP